MPSKLTHAHQFDVLIIGAGSAGLMHALQLSPELKVAVLAKITLEECASFYAQGGISAVLSGLDSFDKHYQDTLDAAQGLGDKNAIRFMVENAPDIINNLEQYGVGFTHQNKRYHLTKEGGHSERRVAHSADKTGQAVQGNLIKQIKHRANITFFEEHIAIDLIMDKTRCIGAYVLDKQTEQVKTFLAQHTVLATGGCAKAYLYTSNPDTSTGDGVAMAYRAGANIVNMEFTQFHPTCLYHEKAKSFLISEALRGEGAKLRLSNGEYFMHRHHPKAELAPRDVVARAIDNEMKTKGLDCVYLDISFKEKGWIIKHFPMIYQKCLSFGIDITQQWIPVVPAAHYSCGGVATDCDGKTNINGLYALGESAYTGVHGANRLASNSLLECLVFAKSAAHDINTQQPLKHSVAVPDWDDSRVGHSNEKVVVSHLWDELRRIMWNFVGIVRSTRRLNYAQKRITRIQIEVNDYYRSYFISNDLIELRNLSQIAQLIIESALQRKESRGLHFTSDYPDKQKQVVNTILSNQHRRDND